MFWKQFLKLFHMKQGNIRVYGKGNIFEVKCREEKGELFGVNKGM